MWSAEPLDASRLLYLAEDAVTALLAKDEPLSDRLITPAGALLYKRRA